MLPSSSDHIEVTSLAERIVGGATFVGVSNENELATMATQMASNSSSCGDFTGKSDVIPCLSALQQSFGFKYTCPFKIFDKMKIHNALMLHYTVSSQHMVLLNSDALLHNHAYHTCTHIPCYVTIPNLSYLGHVMDRSCGHAQRCPLMTGA